MVQALRGLNSTTSTSSIRCRRRTRSRHAAHGQNHSGRGRVWWNDAVGHFWYLIRHYRAGAQGRRGRRHVGSNQVNEWTGQVSATAESFHQIKFFVFHAQTIDNQIWSGRRCWDQGFDTRGSIVKVIALGGASSYHPRPRRSTHQSPCFALVLSRALAVAAQKNCRRDGLGCSADAAAVPDPVT